MGCPVTTPPVVGLVEQRQQILRRQDPFEAAIRVRAVALCRLVPGHEQALLPLDDGPSPFTV